jgi:hypothetical protein
MTNLSSPASHSTRAPDHSFAYSYDYSQIIKNGFIIFKCFSLIVGLLIIIFRSQKYINLKELKGKTDINQTAKAVFGKIIRNIAIMYIFILLIVGAYELSPSNYSKEIKSEFLKIFLDNLLKPITLYYLMVLNLVC